MMKLFLILVLSFASLALAQDDGNAVNDNDFNIPTNFPETIINPELNQDQQYATNNYPSSRSAPTTSPSSPSRAPSSSTFSYPSSTPTTNDQFLSSTTSLFTSDSGTHYDEQTSATYTSSDLNITPTPTTQELTNNDSSSLPTTPTTIRPFCIRNSTREFFGRFRSFLSSIVPEPIGRLIRRPLDFSQAASEDVRRRYERFMNFMQKFHKFYNPTELPRRFELFSKRLGLIEQSAREFAEGVTTYELGLNQFVDWDESELKTLASLKLPPQAELDALMLNNNTLSDANDSNSNSTTNANNIIGQSFVWPSFSSSFSSSTSFSNGNSVSQSKDWRQSGCMGPVQDQLHCGSCYAYASLGVLAAMKCLATKQPYDELSSQELVDCSRSEGNDGCDGGFPTNVFAYFNKHGSISTQSCYPYKSKVGTCLKNRMTGKCRVSTSVSGMSRQVNFSRLTGEAMMKRHLDSTGPLIAVLEALDRWYMYKNGVYSDNRCRGGRTVNHGVIIAGYGEENGRKYWLIKNSWGTDWGQGGYGKFLRGSNACAIESIAWGIHLR